MDAGLKKPAESFYMAENKIQMPAGFGGLMRFSEEYKSRIMLKPAYIIVFVILIIAFRIFLEFIFWPKANQKPTNIVN